MRNCTLINKGKYPFLILVRLFNQIKKIAKFLTEFYKPKMKICNIIKVIYFVIEIKFRYNNLKETRVIDFRLKLK